MLGKFSRLRCPIFLGPGYLLCALMLSIYSAFSQVGMDSPLDLAESAGSTPKTTHHSYYHYIQKHVTFARVGSAPQDLLKGFSHYGVTASWTPIRSDWPVHTAGFKPGNDPRTAHSPGGI